MLSYKHLIKMEEKLLELEACLLVRFELANTLVVWNFGAACRSVVFMPEIHRYRLSVFMPMLIELGGFMLEIGLGRG